MNIVFNWIAENLDPDELVELSELDTETLLDAIWDYIDEPVQDAIIRMVTEEMSEDEGD